MTTNTAPRPAETKAQADTRRVKEAEARTAAKGQHVDATYENGKKVRLDLPALATAYKRAAASGEGSRVKAYDAAVRALSIVPSTKSVKGVDVALTTEEKAREVTSAFGIGTDGGVFKMRAPRIAQIFRTYTAQGEAGIDPFAKEGHALFTKFENVRRYDAEALPALSKAIKADKAKDADEQTGAVKILDEAIEAAKAKAKARTAAAKAAKTAKGGLKDLTATFGDMLPMVRDAVAKATNAEKAEARAALEAMLAHLK
jgi:hypothetical protein